MKPRFDDIRDRIEEKPTWYDRQGTPRYGVFSPDALGVYDNVAVLYEISCQACGEKFFVGEGYSRMDMHALNWHWSNQYLRWRETKENGIEADFVEEEYVFPTLEDYCSSYHYGDPPIHGCVGDTMNCIDLRVVEAWHQPNHIDGTNHVGQIPANEYNWRWIRREDLEKEFPVENQPWAHEE